MDDRGGGEEAGADMRKLFIETYGCQMNEADSGIIASIMGRNGYELVEDPEDADVIIVNTCSVREHAEIRAIGRISQLAAIKKRKPDLVLCVSGCMAQRMKGRIYEIIPNVDVVAGPDSYKRLPELIEEAVSRKGEGSFIDVKLRKDELYSGIEPFQFDRVRAWVTIMRGCNRFCSFCIVPFVRGRERFVPLQEILEELERLAKMGYKEVTFLGQTVNSYRYEDKDFADLLLAASEVEGIERIRFTSPYPLFVTEKMIEAMRVSKKVCPHIHLPVQSASDKILSLMKRGYTIAQYEDVIHKLRDRIPGIAITTDIIVGFPGEEEEDFLATYDFMMRTRFDSAFIFKYSPREGTRATILGDPVPEEEKLRRLEAVIGLQERISEEINKGFIGRDVEVLVECDAKRGEGRLFGRTPHFKSVVFSPGDKTISPGDIVPVRVTDATSHTLLGVYGR
jgi:tRNA-2-methylthio-N6-dimethylallyladenosine synthase